MAHPPLATAAAPLAAIDIGSNSFRLEIAQFAGGRYRRIEYLKETVRLGAGLDAEGRLTEAAAERGLACLRRFAERLAAHAGLEPARVRAVATQTLREARNRDAWLQRARQALGHEIEVISGREEARLIYAGVSRLQAAEPARAPRLVIDIGGRSTELILGRGREVLAAESFGIGCVSLSMRHFPDGAMTRERFHAAQVAAGAEFEEALQPFAREHWKQALGSSGTAGAVSQVLAAAGVSDGRITPAGLRWCIERCLAAGHVDAIELPGLKPDRRAVLPGGLAILYTLAAHFDIGELLPAKGALRQGVIFDLEERLAAALHEGAAGAPAGRSASASGGGSEGASERDQRDRSVAALQQRFGIDQAQAARVGAVALHLLHSVRPDAGADLRRELAWACALHEIGLMVSHHDHHRHSAYLMAHVDAPGFSQSQQRRLGELVLGQRGGLRKIEAQLASEAGAWQVLCLRLAVIACHARSGIDITALSLRSQGQGREARLVVSPAWLQQHPRTAYLWQEEAEAWSRNGPLRLVLPQP